MNGSHNDRRDHDLEHADSGEIRNRIDDTRARMDRTVDEVVDRMRPSSLLHDLVDWLDIDRESAARLRAKVGGFGRRLGDDLARNPVPAVLIGSGLVWLATCGRGHRHADLDDESHEGIGTKLGRVKDRAKDGASHAMASAKGAVSSVRDAASSAKGFAANAVSKTAEAAARTRERTARAFDEAPLAIGIGAAAVGLLCGMMLPSTEAEDRAMGERADRFKEGAKEAASRAAGRAVDVAASAVAAGTEAASEVVIEETERSGTTARGTERERQPTRRPPPPV